MLQPRATGEHADPIVTPEYSGLVVHDLIRPVRETVDPIDAAAQQDVPDVLPRNRHRPLGTLTHERLVSDWRELGYSEEVYEKVFYRNAEAFFPNAAPK